MKTVRATIIGLWVLGIAGCQTMPVMQQDVKQTAAPVSSAVARIINIDANHKTTSIEAAEAYLMGKIALDNGDFDTAEKLFNISYSFEQNVISGLGLVRAKMASGKVQEAQELAVTLWDSYSDDENVALTLANIYQVQNNQDALLAVLQKAALQNPNDEEVHIAYALSDKEQSKAILLRFLANNPGSDKAYLTLAKITYKEGELTQALKYAQSAYNIAPDTEDNIKILALISQDLKNYAKAEFLFRTLFEQKLDNANATNYINVLMLENKLDVALQTLLRLELSSDIRQPFLPDFNLLTAKILLLNGDYGAASVRLNTLLADNFSADEVRYYLAICAEKSRDLRAELRYLTDINSDSIYYSVASKAKIITLINLGENAQAESAIAALSNQDNSRENVMFRVSLLSYFNKSEEALKLLDAYIVDNLDDKTAYLKKADLLSKLKSDQETIDFLKTVVHKWPNFHGALNYLAYALVLQNKDLSTAHRILAKLVRAAPNNGFYLDSLGWLYYQKGNFKTALKYLQEAQKILPDEPIVNYHLAMLQLAINNPQEALNNFKLTQKILSNMLIFEVASNPEWQGISKNIDVQIARAKQLAQLQ